MATDEMYRENILDHYRHPRNRGRIERADSEARDSNPICGDDITMQISVRDGKLQDVKFEGSACAICLASASMLTEEMKDRKAEDARKYGKEKLLSAIGIDPGPVRLKCALLPLKVFKLALYKHLGKKMAAEEERL